MKVQVTYKLRELNPLYSVHDLYPMGRESQQPMHLTSNGTGTLMSFISVDGEVKAVVETRLGRFVVVDVDNLSSDE